MHAEGRVRSKNGKLHLSNEHGPRCYKETDSALATILIDRLVHKPGI